MSTESKVHSGDWHEMADAELDGTIRDCTLHVLTRQAQAEARKRLLPALREVRRRYEAGQTVAGFSGFEDYLHSIGINPNTVRSWEYRLRQNELKSRLFET